MAVYLSPVGNGFQFFDTNGKPLNAGLLNTYAAGSTTPTNTYTTSAGTVANANPIVLGTDGRPPQEIWFSTGVAYKFVLTDSLSNLIGTYDNLYGIGDPLAPNQATIGNDFVDFRLTLTSGLPVTVSNVTAATVVYATPCKGNRISLFDGTATWNTRTSAEMQIAVPATTSQMYDVFCYDSSGTPTLELTAWTSDTTRATGLVLQNGVYVKSGATTRRYLGSFRTTGVSGQTEDSLTKRYVWNYYHRACRQMRAVDATPSWIYNTNAWRQANANAANQLDFVIGVSEDTVEAHVKVIVVNSAGVASAIAGIGLDITNGQNAHIFGATQATNAVTLGLYADYENTIAAGRHFLAWLEDGAGGAGNTTWTGTDGGALGTSGISGKLWA